MSVLTGRYSGSPETAFDYDIRRIDDQGMETYLASVESAELSDAFWNAGLPQEMNTSVASSPFFNVYLAAQVKMNDKGFLSHNITVSDLISYKGDVHHIFPRNYLKRHGLTRGSYNQIANYVMMQSEINISIGDKPPAEYFKELYEQCENGDLKYGGIKDINELRENIAMHCIPDRIDEFAIDHYQDFLEERRKLMADKIRKYYNIL